MLQHVCYSGNSYKLHFASNVFKANLVIAVERTLRMMYSELFSYARKIWQGPQLISMTVGVLALVSMDKYCSWDRSFTPSWFIHHYTTHVLLHSLFSGLSYLPPWNNWALSEGTWLETLFWSHLACGHNSEALSSLIIGVGGLSPLWEALWAGKWVRVVLKTSRKEAREQVSRHRSFIVLVSRLLS